MQRESAVGRVKPHCPPLPSVYPCVSALASRSWEVMLGASFPPSPQLRKDWGWWGLCEIGLQSLLVLFLADVRTEEVTCSQVCQDVSRLLLAAQLVPSTFPMSNAIAGETVRSLWVGFPQGLSHRLRKAILTRGEGLAAPWLVSPFPWTISFQHLSVCLLEYPSSFSFFF